MKVALRADATRHSGVGHVMRCLALADELRRQGAETLFISRHLVGSLAALIEGQGHTLTMLGLDAPDEIALVAQATADPASWLGVDWQQDAADTATALAAIGAVDWLVVDHYGLDQRWESLQRSHCSKVMVIDDLANRPHQADLLLDQNLYGDADQRYRERVPSTCRQLLGPRYALLRPAFESLHQAATVRQGPVRRLLVFMGGADVANYTSLVLDAIDLLALPALQVDVVIGSAHPARDELFSRCAARPGTRLHVDTTQVAELMAAADLAVGAGGTATWERCATGVPALALCVADNQRELLQHASRQGLLLSPELSSMTAELLHQHLGAFIDNPALRELISRCALAVVDGQGTSRVARVMRAASEALHWREATMADAEALLGWRNHPAIRSVSHSDADIDLAGHRAWLANVLADPDRHLLIGMLRGEPVGVVRFDVRRGVAEVSIYRVPDRSEPGLGSALLCSAELWLQNRRPDAHTLVAEVLAGNRVSQALFEGNGFSLHTLHYQKRIQP